MYCEGHEHCGMMVPATVDAYRDGAAYHTYPARTPSISVIQVRANTYMTSNPELRKYTRSVCVKRSELHAV